MTDFDYRQYSLEQLSNWVHDAMSSGEATPQEIYDTIRKVVEENYYTYKQQTSQAYELLALLNGNGDWKIEDVLKEKEYYQGWGNYYPSNLVCDKDDPSPECQKSWNDFWEENYYPEEEKQDDGMRPWGHSDLEYMIANPTLTEDRISNFPGEQHTEEELNAMCDKETTEEDKEKCREYNLREAEYYNKRVEIDAKKNKVNRWVLPVEVDGLTGECYFNLPDDLLEAANLKEGDTLEYIPRNDGSFELRKSLRMGEC
jgi:hypothetical protein